MPKFCTHCGSPVGDTVKFCGKCGAALEAVAAPVVAAPPPTAAPAAPSPTAPTAAPAPPKKGSPVLKIVLAVVALFVFITVAGLGTCVYIGYRAKKKFNEMAARVKQEGVGAPEVHLGTGGAGTEAGTEAASEATKDVPSYPASTPTQAGGGMTFGTSGGVHSQEYETSDSVDQVLAFYKDKLGPKITIVQSEGNAEFNYTTQTGMTTVTITRDESAGKTKITIARIGK